MKTNRPYSNAVFCISLILAACLCLSSCLPQSDKDDAQQVLSTIERYQRFTQDARTTIANTGFPEGPGVNRALQQADNQLRQLAASAAPRLRDALAKNSLWDGSAVATTVGTSIPTLDGIRATLQPVETAIAEWKKLRSDPAVYVAGHKALLLSSKPPDFDPVRSAVREAMTDWPEKQSFLERKLKALDQETTNEQARQTRVADALEAASRGDLPAEQTVFVELSSAESPTQRVRTEASELKSLASQLYIGRDRILEDLDPDNEDGPRAKFRTVTLVVKDAAHHLWDRDFSDEWMPVPNEDTWNTYKDRIGMSFERKPPGKFESETERLPQPAEMAYIAPSDQTQNQFGSWSANESGGREWHWFEQYLLLSALLNHNSTLTSHDYEDFRRTASTGATWYGKDATTGQAKFGTYGTNLVSTPKAAGFRDSKFSTANSSGTFGSSPFASAGGTFRASRYANTTVASSTPGSFGKSGMSFGGSSSGRAFGGASSGLSFGSARSSSSSFSSASRSVSSSGRSFGGGRR